MGTQCICSLIQGNRHQQLTKKQLETDQSLLEQKSKKSLASYGHQLVVANLLQNHKDCVVLYSHSGTVQPIQRSVEEKSREIDVESKLIPAIIECHRAFYS